MWIISQFCRKERKAKAPDYTYSSVASTFIFLQWRVLISFILVHIRNTWKLSYNGYTSYWNYYGNTKNSYPVSLNSNAAPKVHWQKLGKVACPVCKDQYRALNYRLLEICKKYNTRMGWELLNFETGYPESPCISPNKK